MTGMEETKAASSQQYVTSSLGEELAANPFLRTRESTVVEAARKLNPEASAGTSTMAVIRAWKDRF